MPSFQAEALPHQAVHPTHLHQLLPCCISACMTSLSSVCCPSCHSRTLRLVWPQAEPHQLQVVRPMRFIMDAYAELIPAWFLGGVVLRRIFLCTSLVRLCFRIWPCVPCEEVPRDVCRNSETIADYWGATNSLASTSLAELLRVNTSKSGDGRSSVWRSVFAALSSCPAQTHTTSKTQ